MFSYREKKRSGGHLKETRWMGTKDHFEVSSHLHPINSDLLPLSITFIKRDAKQFLVKPG